VIAPDSPLPPGADVAVRVFVAASLDGFIAGPDDDLSWLPESVPDEDYGYGELMATTGAILMGRSTYRVVESFDGPWPYGDTPVFVATTRPLEPAAPTVRALRGTAEELLADVRAVTAGNVYVDGGSLIRQFLDAGLVDELTVTVIPVVLGAGAPLFAGAARRHDLDLQSSRTFPGGIVQLRYSLRRAPASDS
jgi:dihydrofolate reductase